MERRNHSIELFRKTLAPEHTALNKRESSGSSRFKNKEKSVSKKDTPPPARWACSELLNVLNGNSADCGYYGRASCIPSNNITFPNCRAPPVSGFSQKI